MNRLDTVLFVDDEPRILDGLRHGLRKESYTILTAISGEVGLKILACSPVDVVVSDEQMPGMCGSEFLAAVCRLYPETIRMTLTGQASLEAAIRAINEGEIYRFLAKPCNIMELSNTIHQALQLKKLRHESSRLLVAARQQRTLLSDLEREHPGIAKVKRSQQGEIILEETNDDLDILINEINLEIGLFESDQSHFQEWSSA